MNPKQLPPPHSSSNAKASPSDAKRKGLRHFAVRVCKKVEEKGNTSYNEVADELVNEERVARQSQQQVVDEKNIRRRVYDSLNVLMAMGILAKDKKQISWQGLSILQPPAPVIDKYRMKNVVDAARQRVIEKKKNVFELSQQVNRIMNLIHHRNVTTGGDEGDEGDEQHRLTIPFMIVTAKHNANINLTMTENKQDICFTFDNRFALFDDTEILKRLPWLNNQRRPRNTPPTSARHHSLQLDHDHHHQDIRPIDRHHDHTHRDYRFG